MRQRDAVWEQLAKNGDFTLETVAVINGKTYDAITAPNLKGGLLAGDSLSVGNCISTTCKFTVMTTDEIPKAAQVVFRSRLTNGETGDDLVASQWKDMGTFWINKRTVNDDLVDLECYDAMMLGNQPYSDNSASKIWPKPMKTVAERIAQQMGVSMDSRTTYYGDNVPYSILTVVFEETTTYPLCAKAYGDGTVSVDWGDGSTGQLPTTDANIQTHVYSPGTYMIKLTPSNTSVEIRFNSSYRNALSDPYLIKAFVGSQGVVQANGGFGGSVNLEELCLANGPDRIWNNILDGCTKLERLVIPPSVYMLWSDITRGSGVKTVRLERTTSAVGIQFNASFDSSVTLEVPASLYQAYTERKTIGAYTYPSIFEESGAGNIVTFPDGEDDYGKYGDYIVTKPSDNDTLLDLLRWIGSANGGNWVITPENKLRLVPLVSPPPASYFVIDESYNRIQTDDGYNLIYNSGGTGSSEMPTDAELIAKYGYAPHLMNVPVVIGQIGTIPTYSVSRVTMTYAETPENTAIYTNGDDTGYHLYIEQNPYATQAMCDDLYARLNGIVYAPYNVTQACFDPCLEYGDWVTVGDTVSGVLYNMEQRFDLSYRADIFTPGENEIDNEYPFLSQAQRTRREVSALSTNSAYIVSALAAKANKNQLRSEFASDGTSIVIQEGTIAFESDDTSTGILRTQGRLQDSSYINESSVFSFNNGMLKMYSDAYTFPANNSYDDLVDSQYMLGSLYLNAYSSTQKVLHLRSHNGARLIIGAGTGTSLYNTSEHTGSQISIDPLTRAIDISCTTLTMKTPNNTAATGVTTSVTVNGVTFQFRNGICIRAS